jgi:hypothetical protein
MNSFYVGATRFRTGEVTVYRAVSGEQSATVMKAPNKYCVIETERRA